LEQRGLKILNSTPEYPLEKRINIGEIDLSD
jgi:hypothetical protein